MPKNKKPIINAHAHIFTHKYVPPYLAKSILPWGIYHLIHLPTLIKVSRWLSRQNRAFRYSGFARRCGRQYFNITNAIGYTFIAKLVYSLIKYWLIIFSVITCFYWASRHFEESDFKGFHYLEYVTARFIEWGVIFPNKLILSSTIVLFSFLLIKQVRSLLTFIVKKLGNLFKLLPSKESRAL